MKQKSAKALLQTGLIKADSAAAASAFLALPLPRQAAVRQLMHDLCSPNPETLRPAAQLARLIATRDPQALRKYSDVLVSLAMECPESEWQARGYIALAAAYSAHKHRQRITLAEMLQRMMKDDRIAVRAHAIEALATVALEEPAMQSDVAGQLEEACQSSTPAIRARARRMLPLVAKAAKAWDERS